MRHRWTKPRAMANDPFGYGVILDASPSAILAVDPGGIITYANPRVATTFGYEPVELLGQPFSMLVPDALKERHADHHRAYLTHPVARPMGMGQEVVGRRRDGSEVPVEISLSPVETPDGLLVVATVVDITARIAAATKLLQTQKLESIGRLAGGIAHDFNNMLFAILGYAELLEQDLAPGRRGMLDAELALRNARGITFAAERAATLTRQLLAFSQQQVVSPEVIDLNDAVRRIEPLLRRLIGENVHLVTRLEPTAGRLRADPGQLEQILVNLVVNARDAMPAGGTVTVATGSAVVAETESIDHFDVLPGTYVMVAVTDTGEGMDPETRQHLYEPFFTTKALGKGTGLGLATVYSVVRHAGGHIRLRTESGEGTTFKLYFPSVDADVVVGASLPAAPGGDQQGLVLVIEDEAMVRDLTRVVLERAGYRVIAVADGAEALTTIADPAHSIDALVTDVVMPGMSGIELAERVMDLFPRLPIVLLSGYTAETLNLERIAQRGAAFVAKPVSGPELLRAIRGAMSRDRSAA